jgi:hypothetical protein
VGNLSLRHAPNGDNVSGRIAHPSTARGERRPRIRRKRCA